MSTYRQKPIEVEAVRVIRGYMASIMVDECPDWWREAVNAGVISTHSGCDGVKDGLLVPTPDGEKLATVGDYIVCAANGDLDVVKPDAFERIYAPAKPYYLEVYDWAFSRMEGCDEPEFSLFSGICDVIARYRREEIAASDNSGEDN